MKTHRTIKFSRAVRNANKRAKENGDTNRIDLQQVTDRWEVTIFCSICGRFVEESDASLDHLVPLANGGLNQIDNIVIVHFWCNNIKGNEDMLVATDRILKTYPIEETGSILIDSLAISLGGPYAVNPVKRSELPENFGDLPYLQQVELFDPPDLIKLEYDIMERIRST